MIPALTVEEYILHSSIPATRTGREMKKNHDNAGGNRSNGPTISRSLRQFWQRLVDLIAALPKDRQPRPVRIVVKTRDRNHRLQRY